MRLRSVQQRNMRGWPRVPANGRSTRPGRGDALERRKPPPRTGGTTTGAGAGGLSGSEQQQSDARNEATAARRRHAELDAGAVHLVPQLGSPIAMKYGGQEAATAQLRGR